MSDPVTVINMALSILGKTTINDIDEPSTEARAARVFFDHARRTFLQASDWTFARQRIALAKLENDFPERWAYRYKYPVIALKVLRIVGPFATRRHDRARPAFEVREGSIYTVVDGAIAEIIVDVTDMTRYPPLAINAFVYHLATYLARPLTRNTALIEEMRQEREAAISAAITADATQDAPQYGIIPFDDYTRERF